MSWMAATSRKPELNLGQTAVLLASGAAAFHLAYYFRHCSFLIVIYLYSLAGLARQATGRRAFYFGLGAGMLAYAPQLGCFYAIFGLAAVVLGLGLGFF